MDENTVVNENENDNANANVTINIPVSDIQYSLYRKELIETGKMLEIDPNACLSKCGIIIRSHQLDEFVYQMYKTTFGSQNNIINTLAYTLITILKNGAAGTEQEQKKNVLRSFLSFFESAAKEQFFGEEGFEDSSNNID